MTLILLLDEEAIVADDDIGVDIDPVAQDVVKIILEDEIVVDSAYLDPANYSIQPVTPGDIIPRIRAVLEPNSAVTTTILLQIDKPTEGGKYFLEADNLHDRNGGTLQILEADLVTFVARFTKTDSMLRSLPDHFDPRPKESLIRNLLTAITMSDELIGGSKDEPL